MKVGRKLIFIVLGSVALVAIPATMGIYFFTKQQLLKSESIEIAAETADQLNLAREKITDYEFGLNSLTKRLKRAIAAPPRHDDEERFYEMVSRQEDQVWRNKPELFDGTVEAGVFIPPKMPLSSEQIHLHYRTKKVIESFGSSITLRSGNVWFATTSGSEIIFDRKYPKFVFQMTKDTDYTNTPWLMLGNPKDNPKRKSRWTPPLFDSVSKTWMVSVVAPVDIGRQWVGNVGRDFGLQTLIGIFYQKNTHNQDELRFIIDGAGNYIHAGPWQRQLESMPTNFHPDLNSTPELANALSLPLGNNPVILGNDIPLLGKEYLTLGLMIPELNWRYYRLVPTESLIKPINQLLISLLIMLLMTGIVAITFIHHAIRRNIVDRLKKLTQALYDYGQGEHNARASLAGKDEIAEASREFDAMAEHINATMEAIPDLLLDVGIDGRLYATYSSGSAIKSRRGKQISGKSIQEMFEQEAAIVIMSAIKEANNDGLSRGLQYRESIAGRQAWFELSVAKKSTTQHESKRFILLSRDITERKQAIEEIQTLAFFDSLTRLPNRRLLTDRLHHALLNSERTGKQGALLFLDLDNFKDLNDSFGHDVGDTLLKQVAERILSTVRKNDTVARLGGDEFVVLLEDLDIDAEDAALRAEVIAAKMLSLLNQPYTIGAHEHYNTASIGVSIFDGGKSSVEDLLKQADIAMYQSKKASRNTVRFFDPAMQDTVIERSNLERELRKGITQNQLVLYYQVQVDYEGRPLGAEALVRWDSPDRGIVSPNQFIPLAEESELIVHIGQWVLNSACQQLATWQQSETSRDYYISINVSAKQFHRPDFVPHLKKCIELHQINPELLKLELTESFLLENIEESITTMNVLGKMGIRFALDDFGTGYSSLQYLKRLPLSELKIDRSFVREIARDNNDQVIVRTIIVMARTLNFHVIAEGVETEAQKAILLSCGCTALQGFLFGQPVPIQVFETYLGLFDQKL